jgi:DNA adenine methylase
LDSELMNFWRQLQFHPMELARALRLIPYSAELWKIAVKSRSVQPTEILRAAMFCFASLGSKNGLMSSFCGRKPKLHPLVLVGRKIRRLAARMRNVVCEQLPFERAIEFYDSPHTLFYADPPYPGRHPYRLKFSQEQFNDLVRRLGRARGRAVLSCGPEQRQALTGWRIGSIPVCYSTKIGERTPTRELLARNF